MSLGCHPKEERAAYLKARLTPSILLAALAAATQPGRPYVELLGIKSSSDDWRALQDVHGPRFRAEVENDPAIRRQLDQLRAIGFSFDWRRYSDPTGEEYNLVIMRNPEAEARLGRRAMSTS